MRTDLAVFIEIREGDGDSLWISDVTKCDLNRSKLKYTEFVHDLFTEVLQIPRKPLTP